MRIVACVKSVPDPESERRIEEGRLVRGEDEVLNELDEYAVEAAVSLVEERGGEVIALTMGPEDASDALTRALQMGADRAVLLSDPGLEGADAVTTAKVLAAAIGRLAQEEPIDLVVTGMASLDGMTSMFAPALSRALSWPLLDLAAELDVSSGMPPEVRIVRKADGYEDVLAADVPAVVSVSDQINEPRYPSFKDLRAARSKPVDEWTLESLGLGPQDVTSLVRVVGAEPKERQAGTVVTDSGEGGVALAKFLRANVSA